MRKLFFLLGMAMCSLLAFAQEGFVLSQNIPNPFCGTTTVYLATSTSGEITLAVADVFGSLQTQQSQMIEAGVHKFQISLRAKGNYVLGAHQNGKRASIVLFCEEGGLQNRIDYAGWVDEWEDEVYQNITAEDTEEEFVGYAEQKSKAENQKLKEEKI